MSCLELVNFRLMINSILFRSPIHYEVIRLGELGDLSLVFMIRWHYFITYNMVIMVGCIQCSISLLQHCHVCRTLAWQLSRNLALSLTDANISHEYHICAKTEMNFNILSEENSVCNVDRFVECVIFIGNLWRYVKYFNLCE